MKKNKESNLSFIGEHRKGNRDILRLKKDIEKISLAGYITQVDINLEFIVIENFKLPTGYNFNFTKVLIMIPGSYPYGALGMSGGQVYLRGDLLFNGYRPKDYHYNEQYSFKGWNWWCFEQVDWEPYTDDILYFIDNLLRYTISNPKY